LGLIQFDGKFLFHKEEVLTWRKFVKNTQNPMMKRILKIIAIVLLVLAAGAAIVYYAFLKPKDPPISAEDRAQINLMPLPAALKLEGFDAEKTSV
jgi:flagellar basal body-associated protein FliL